MPLGSVLAPPWGVRLWHLAYRNTPNLAFGEVFAQDVFSAIFFNSEGLPLQWSNVAHMLYIVYGLHVAPFGAWVFFGVSGDLI